MAIINLRDYYPFYTSDCFMEVSEEVAEMFKEFERKEAAYRLRTYRHKAYYSLDRDDGLEHEAVFVALSPHELYERKVTMQIQNLNALVDTVRHEIIERYRPGEDDPHLKVLQAAHISDDEYFNQMVRDDLNLIIRDIREAHKKDSESAPQTTVANELKENLEAVENFKGSRDEKLVVLYCKQLGINYKNLSDEEFRWLIRILKKSKKMGTPISQRKKR